MPDLKGLIGFDWFRLGVWSLGDLQQRLDHAGFTVLPQPDGQMYFEASTDAYFGFNLDLALHAVDDFLAQVQPKACVLDVESGLFRVEQAHEFFEVFFFDATACIFYFDVKGILVVLVCFWRLFWCLRVQLLVDDGHFHRDMAVLCKLDGVSN